MSSLALLLVAGLRWACGQVSHLFPGDFIMVKMFGEVLFDTGLIWILHVQAYIVSFLFRSINVAQLFVQLDYEYSKNTYQNLQNFYWELPTEVYVNMENVWKKHRHLMSKPPCVHTSLWKIGESSTPSQKRQKLKIVFGKKTEKNEKHCRLFSGNEKDFSGKRRKK